MDLLLTGGLVFDGTGSPARRLDVGVNAGRLVLDPDPADVPAVRRDVSGLAVCPGFVDIHTHSDLTLLSNPLGDSKIRQGVTTEVVGNCGLGVAPIVPHGAASAETVREAVGYLDLDPAVALDWQDFAGYLGALDATPTGPNVAALVPHLPVHAGVVGLDDRRADAGQIDRMVALFEQSCDAGAVGISTGLVYAPLCYAAEDELVAIGEVVARRDRLFAWHVRDYGDDLIPSVAQAVRVARTTGCRTQISHLTAVGRRNWGTVGAALELIDAAIADGVDIGIDTYPYLAGNAPLSQLLPDWAQQGGSEVFAPRLRDRQVRARVLDGWRTASFDWNDIVINALAGEAADDRREQLVGHTVTALAADHRTEPGELALDLLAEYGAAVLMVAYGRSDDDLRTVLAHPATVVASDGQAIDPAGPTGAAGRPHPRSYGCFPRYLTRYATDLEDGIRRCTSAPAARVGLTDRGRVAAGLAADLLVFDPAGLCDTATFDDPQQFPRGVDMVIVGGAIVLDNGIDTGARPGRVLRRHDRPVVPDLSSHPSPRSVPSDPGTPRSSP